MRRIGRISLLVVFASALGVLPDAANAILIDTGGHRSSLHAKVTLSDGATRSVIVAGVGCTQAIALER